MSLPEKKLKSKVHVTRTSLHTAILSEKVNIVKTLLSQGTIVDAADKLDQTALHIAVSTGNQLIIKLLLDHKAKITAKDYQGRIPLHLAAQTGHIKVIRQLLNKFQPEKKSSIINAKALDEETPLHLAAFNGHSKVVKYLLEHGAKVNLKNKDGGTPLHFAATKGNSETVKQLLKSGADIHCTTKEGFTALHCAVLEDLGLNSRTIRHEKHDRKLKAVQVLKRIQVIDALIEAGVDLNKGDENSRSPLHFATVRNHFIIVKRLIDWGADVNITDSCCKTPLHIAAAWSPPYIVRILLNSGANTDILSLEGSSPIHCALQRSNLKVISMMVSAGENINATTHSNETLFCQLPFYKFNGSILDFLLDCGADLNAKDCQGRNALHDFARHFCYKHLGILFERFLDLNAENVNGSTPLNYAVANMFEHGEDYYAKFLVKALVKMESVDKVQISGRNMQIISKLFSQLYQDCKAELEALKKKVYGQVTFYDLLIRPTWDLTSYARNEKLIGILDSGACEEFKVYGDLIEDRMRMALGRKKLLESSLKVLIRLFSPKRGPKLPHLIGFHVLSFLNSIELENLSNA